jgi:penicillin-binding protein 1B
MSRFSTRDQLVIALWSIPVLLLYALIGYLWVLNARMSRELLGRQWRTSTDIYSASDLSAPIVRVYGSDWRLTSPVLLKDLPPQVANAFLAAEDIRFRRHFGVDPIGMARALVTNVRSGGIRQGGSTINQQLVKTKFLTQERTYRRKFLEILLALMLDVRLTKDEILEAYLNEIYLGHIRGQPVLGIDEAALIYFDKRAERLRLDEAALLASIARAPNRDTPDKRPELARARRDIVLKRLREHDLISDEDLKDALARPVRFTYGRLPPTPYPYYLSALRSELRRQLGERVSSQSGLKIYCEINPRMQLAAEQAARKGVQALRRRYSWIRELSESEPLQAAILSVDPLSGGVRALVGGADFRATQFDRTRLMKRQPGSAFKTFAFVAALDTRTVSNATLLVDAPVRVELASDKVWEPHNYDERYRGRVTLREAFEMSLNVPTVRLSQSIGVSRVARIARKFGFKEDLPAVPALPLGVAEVTMRELVAAYTVFPNLGERVEPFLLTQVRDPRGRRIYRHQPERSQVINADIAYVTHTLLRGVVRRGTASRLRRYGLSHVAGKTGTTSDYRDAWFVGYTPDLVSAVWVGFDRGGALRLSSAEAALPIWGAYVREIPTSRNELGPPDEVQFRNIDPETGYLWAEGCPGPYPEVFLQGTEPTVHCPRGFIGGIIRRVFFDADSFDEPPAITLEKFRRWSEELERNRNQMESRLERLRRFFRGDDKDEDRGTEKRKGRGKDKDRDGGKKSRGD